MRRRAQILRLVVAFNASIKHGEKKQGRLLATVWHVAGHALALGHRAVTYRSAEETRMARAAGRHHQIRVHLHPVAGIVATAALPLYHRTVP